MWVEWIRWPVFSRFLLWWFRFVLWWLGFVGFFGSIGRFGFFGLGWLLLVISIFVVVVLFEPVVGSHFL